MSELSHSIEQDYIWTIAFKAHQKHFPENSIGSGFLILSSAASLLLTEYLKWLNVNKDLAGNYKCISEEYCCYDDYVNQKWRVCDQFAV